MRKVLTTIVVGVLGMAMIPSAAADAYTGYLIPPGNPGNHFGVGVTETLGPCSYYSPFQALDGYWFDIGHEPAGSPLVMTMDPTLDADVYFYDAGCGPVPVAFGNNLGPGVAEHGEVPAGADWMLVGNFAGFGEFHVHIE